jgi:NADH-quinone oxidoreductase subunit L
MFHLLWLVPAIPFFGAALLLLFGSRLPRAAAGFVGCASIAASAVIAGLIAAQFLSSPPPGNAYEQTLWTWIGVDGFRPQIAFYLDSLSLVMMTVVAFVSFFIHLYSTEYMGGDEGFSRFFGYMNLFVGSMLTLVLANNLLLLFLGWEGVGLCSYLLIGFWYRDPANGYAARKAFIVTRVGDTAMTIGLLILFDQLGALHIQEMLRQAAAAWPVGSALPIATAALLLGGALGKSAQLPLQTWLPDAMAGPTPTSALIHAATMVTAGVYLIARTHVLFQLAPPVMLAVAIIGAATLIVSGFSALTQSDIKRALAYSTISQIGYMFLALGVGAWGAAIFHFMTHAFFKALLFLVAGVVIEALHHEQNMFHMGGLRRDLPVAFWTFLIGGASLSGLPFITAGYFSKDLIVWSASASRFGSQALWAAAVAGVVLTALYTFRIVFLVFFGPHRGHVVKRPGAAQQIPLYVLAALSICAGWIGGAFQRVIGMSLPALSELTPVPLTETASGIAAACAFALGLALAWLFYSYRREWATAAASGGFGRALHQFWLADWGMDWLYDRLFVWPVVAVARVNKSDVVDAFYRAMAWFGRLFWRGLSATESGRVRWYATGIAAGAVVYLAIVLFL